MRLFVALSTVCTGLFTVSLCHADTVETQDGSRLNGEIVKIQDGKLSLETSFAGTLEIALADIRSFSSDDAESVRLADGTTAVGPVRSAGAGRITVTTSGGAVSAATADVAAAWTPGEADPDVAAREAELEGQLRKWSYEASVALTGKLGNSEKGDYAASFNATLEGPSDRLAFYGSYQYSESGSPSETTAEEMIGGMNYTNFFDEKLGWYVREELERDRFENITFRSTSAAGMTLRVIKEETVKLELSGGLSIRYEGYGFDLNDDGIEDKTGSESFPGLDFGLKHYWKFAEWGEMNNTVTYNPSFDDFGIYRLDQLSTVDFPLGTADFWKLRLFLQNQYNSGAEASREKLDTTYGVSLLLNWK